MGIMNIANKIELHYFFSDDSHSMDAHVRNRCEHELLAIIQELSTQLGIGIKIDSEAYLEGGLKNIWRLLGKNSSQITLILAILTILISRIPITDPEYDKLKKEELRLSIQEKHLIIEKLQKELEEGRLNESSVKMGLEVVDDNLKIVLRRSNLFKQLDNCHKVAQLGVANLDTNNRLIGEEKIVKRSDFPKFILKSNDLKSITIENAIIEIVSPVLKEGNYKWKGIYLDEPIPFSMTDKEFKEDVLNEKVSFQHGTTIECVLNIHRKLDEVGEIFITGYSVETVILKVDGQVSEETPQGKRYKYEKKQIDGQGDLFAEIKPNRKIEQDQ